MITVFGAPGEGDVVGVLPIGPPEPPADLKRGNWEKYDTQVTVSAAVKLGIPGIVDATGKADGVVVLRQLRTFGRVATEAGFNLFGVSVSLIVRAQGAKIDASTSLAAISAHVELNEGSASAKLDIRGFDDPGFIGQLVSPASLDVQSYTQYIDALNSAQKYIADHADKMYSVFIGQEITPDASDASLREAAVTSQVLKWVAAGRSLSDFLGRYTKLTSTDTESARGTWSTLTDGAGENDSPDRQVVARAQDAIDGIL